MPPATAARATAGRRGARQFVGAPGHFVGAPWYNAPVAPSALLDRVRRALDFDEARVVGGLRAAGAGRLDGLPARVVHESHRDGRAAERVTSRLPGARGFDGARGWSRDAAGLVAPLELGDLEFFRLFDAVLTGRWLAPDGPVEVAEVAAPRGRRALSLRWRGGARRFALAVDDGGLPAALEPASGPPFAVRFGRFDARGWCRMPRELTFETGHLVDRVTLDQVSPCDAIDAAAPAASEPVWHGATGALPLSRSRRGRLPLVHLEVDGRPVGPFLFDTGAGALALDAAVADELALPARGRAWVTTTDGGTGACHRVAGSLRAGPLELAAPVFLELDLAPLRDAMGVRLAGVVGYDLFARAVVAFTDGGARAHVLRPDGPDVAARDGLGWRPLRFEDRCPLVGCAAPGGAGLFALDTGSAAPVTCYADAARAWALAPRPRRGVVMHGASGARAAATCKLPWFDVGDARFESVEATVDLAREGLGGTEGRLGTVGWPLLARLDMVLDCPGARVAFRRPATP